MMEQCPAAGQFRSRSASRSVACLKKIIVSEPYEEESGSILSPF
jgi:hypothetical protein